MANAAEFLIKLNEQVSGPAKVAMGALQQCESAAKTAATAIQAGMGKVGPASASAAGAIKDLGSTVMSLATGPLPSSQKAMTQLGQAMGGAVTAGAHKLSSALATLGPQGAAVGAAIEGLAAVMSATIGVMATFAGLTIGLAEKANRAKVAFEALTGSVAGGAKVGEILGKLGSELPLTAELGKWATGLLQAGVPANQLEKRLRAIAAAQALLGAEAGGAAEALFKKLSIGGAEADAYMKKISKGGKGAEHDLKMLGLGFDDLGGKAKVAKMTASQFADAVAKAVTAKGAKALAQEMNTWPNIIGRAQGGFRSLFAGLGGPVDAFMKKVGQLFSPFFKGGFVIQTLKPIFTSVFTTLFQWATKALDYAYQGMIRLAIWAVKAYIMAHPIIGAFKQLWGEVAKLGAVLASILPAGPKLNILAFIGKSIAGTFQAIVFVVRAVVGVITVAVAQARALITMIKGALGGIGGAGRGAGGNLVSGLVQGIMAGAGAVVAAVKGLASSALSAFTGAFGIRSPSTVMRKHGKTNIAEEGVGEGINQGAPKVKTAMANLLGKPGGAKGAREAGGGDGTVIIQILGDIHGDVDQSKFERMLARAVQAARRAASEMEPAPT